MQVKETIYTDINISEMSRMRQKQLLKELMEDPKISIRDQYNIIFRDRDYEFDLELYMDKKTNRVQFPTEKIKDLFYTLHPDNMDKETFNRFRRLALSFIEENKLYHWGKKTKKNETNR